MLFVFLTRMERKSLPQDRIARREFLFAGSSLFLAGSLAIADEASSRGTSLDITNRISPKNTRRPVRPSTRFIVLHTTEGEENGSLSKIQRRGEAHFVVAPSGRIYRTIDRQRIATHAGRSMWEGLRVIDNRSIGIEVVGYHDRDITPAQYQSLRELLRQLKEIYRIADRDVLTHSMVAYGRPNRFHRTDHRGRKRCGMIFARADVRERLGLRDRPTHDPDVNAGRLRVGDPELYAFLFVPRRLRATVAAPAEAPPAPPVTLPTETNVISRDRSAWQIARDQYDRAETLYVLPDGTRLRGDQVRDWNSIPSGTRVTVEPTDAGEEQVFEGFIDVEPGGEDARNLAGDSCVARTTIYFFPDGLIRTGFELDRRRSTRNLLKSLPSGTRILIGYVYGGHVKSRRPPAAIAGRKWNYPSTYYRLPDGKVVSGDEIDEFAIPAGTLIFFQN